MAISSWFHTFLNSTATALFHYVLRCFCLDSFMSPPQIQINPSTAASSSFVHSTPPSSSSESWKHDVFLSFRGADTRNTIVDHLYSALVQQGIYVYKDDQTLPRGETIGPSLLKAIEESQIAVIVFSENYADSSWCLQELSHIMKCKDENGLIVMPIFYHIDPSELRKQKGKYGEALAKHESDDKNVESWRKALVDAGNLSGDVANGPETVFIKNIVDTISSRLNAAITSDNEDLIGLKARLQDLKSKMEMESDSVLMVGVWGIGGGGKTTLASALYEEISTKFDGSCFLKNVREESSKHGLEILQQKVLSLVLKPKRDEVAGDAGRLIKSRLQRIKVLMVLDDVYHADQLQELAGSNAWFGKGSRIIITTRDKHLLKARKVNVIYNISLLNHKEAIKLFYKHALRDDRAIQDYEMLSKNVVSYAGGLPLALKVLGSFLCDKDMSEWRSALARLEVIPDSDIVGKLKISYDGLKPMEKELFLDIACFFRGEFKRSAIEILDACGYHPIIGVNVLIEKALITVSKKGVFEMHDLIQEMGHYIVRGENPKNPELHSRVWEEEDVANICAMDATTSNNNIEALQIEWHQDELSHILHEVVGNMKNLRWISFERYAEASLPRKFQPKKLCYLQLKWSLVEQLWECYKHLPNLKVLDLACSRKLVKTPDFDGLPCLERLILACCDGLKEIHPSIGYHERLIFLDMSTCASLELFPPIIRMKKLETLILSDCENLCKFPEIQTSMDNLVELSFKETGIVILPSSIGQYCTNLVSLNLRQSRNLESIEGDFHLLKCLKALYLDGCNKLKNIPTQDLFNVECRLHLLSLTKTSLQNGLLGFSRFVRRLNLAYCNLVDGDISSVFCEELSNVEALHLSNNNFSRLHSSLSQLHRLKFLDLSHCFNLVELPDLPSSLSILITDECYSLDILGDFPTNHLKWLWKVSLTARNCNGDRVLQSMLQGNAIEDYFFSIQFYRFYIQIRGFPQDIFTLQLPWNWCNEFSGFLVYIDNTWDVNFDNVILIVDETDDDEEDQNEDNVLEVSYKTDDDEEDDDEEDDDEEDDAEEDDEEEDDAEEDDDEKTMRVDRMCYISFGSLRNTSWWNSTHTTISFFIKKDVQLKVELVPKRSQADDSIETVKDTTYHSNFWDEESPNKKAFEIISDSKSFIQIQWRCYLNRDVFNGVI